MNRHVRETLVQALRLLIVAVEHWDDPEGAPGPEPEERVEPGAPERERRRERLRRRGIPVPGDPPR